MGVFFKDIIGQRAVIEQLKRSVDDNRLAHALLITGPRGNGKLAIAIALANYLLCRNGQGDACGTCPACVKLKKYIHSDLHFVFPVKKKKGSSENPVSDDRFGRVFGYSLAAIFFFHFTINIGMVLGITPVIGIPLPFFSYGGSSFLGFSILLFTFLRIDADRDPKKQLA